MHPVRPQLTVTPSEKPSPISPSHTPGSPLNIILPPRLPKKLSFVSVFPTYYESCLIPVNLQLLAQCLSHDWQLIIVPEHLLHKGQGATVRRSPVAK